MRSDRRNGGCATMDMDMDITWTLDMDMTRIHLDECPQLKTHQQGSRCFLLSENCSVLPHQCWALQCAVVP